MSCSPQAEYTYFTGYTINVSRNEWQAVDGQNTKLAFVLYQRKEDQHNPAHLCCPVRILKLFIVCTSIISIWHNAREEEQMPDHHRVTIHVLVRTFTVHVRHQARFFLFAVIPNEWLNLRARVISLLVRIITTDCSWYYYHYFLSSFAAVFVLFKQSLSLCEIDRKGHN